MSSTTPRVGLYLPADDGSEPVNVATDLNDNMEKLDSAIGFVPATSASPPSTPYDGMATYETDTGRTKFRKGGVWTYLVSAGASFLSDIWLGVGQKLGLGTTTPAAAIEAVVTDSSVNPNVLRFRQTADTQPRIQIERDGFRLGPGGATVPDVRLYRPTANQIAVVGNMSLGNDLSVTGTTALATVNVTGNLNLDGDIVSDVNVIGNLSGTGQGFINLIRKTTDTTRANSITVISDPDFVFNAAANTTYFIELFMIYSGNATGDFRTVWSVPSGSTGLRWSLGQATAGTDREATTMRTGIHQPNTEIIYGGFSATAYNGGQETMTITTAGTAGPIQFRFAQGTANATDPAILRAGSIMQYRVVA